MTCTIKTKNSFFLFSIYLFIPFNCIQNHISYQVSHIINDMTTSLSSLALLYIFLVASCFQHVVSQPPMIGCEDPLTAIMKTLDCVVAEDEPCASSGYDLNFVKLHNGINTNVTGLGSGEFWTGVFALLDMELDYSHQANIGPNQASVRYVEKVTFTNGASLGLAPSTEYPYGAEMLQHEHAIVTVNDDCKMVLWDQYGDNKEQKDVDEAAAMILCRDFDVLPPEVCNALDDPASKKKITVQEE